MERGRRARDRSTAPATLIIAPAAPIIALAAPIIAPAEPIIALAAPVIAPAMPVIAPGVPPMRHLLLSSTFEIQTCFLLPLDDAMSVALS